MTLVLDSSALVAIIEGEPEAESFLAIIDGAEDVVVSAATVLETMIVMLRRHGQAGPGIVERLVARIGAGVIPFDARMAEVAAAAYARFGKGIDPGARLNLGDCVSYALARTLDAPLLFKGADFTATDATACARRFHLRAPLRRRARASARLASRHWARAAFAASALRAACRPLSRSTSAAP